MGVVIIKGERAVLGVNWGHPIVTNGDFAMWLFPNYFGQYLLKHLSIIFCYYYNQLMASIPGQPG